MPAFAYRAKDRQGRVIQDVITSVSVRKATLTLQERELTVLEIVPTASDTLSSGGKLNVGRVAFAIFSVVVVLTLLMIVLKGMAG